MMLNKSINYGTASCQKLAWKTMLPVVSLISIYILFSYLYAFDIYLAISFYLFIYFYFLAALGLCCCARAFSSCSERGLLFVAVRGLLIVVASLCCGAQALGTRAAVVVPRRLSSCGSRALERRLSSCGTWA